jgi:RNA polymerase sigma factor (sigma-70 family)
VAASKEVERQFRLLFDCYYRRVLAYALRRESNRTAAEDVVAETFLVAWRRIGDVPAGDDALPWLLGVARRVLANARRTDARRDRLLARLRQEPMVEVTEAVDAAPLASDARAQILGALSRLRPGDAELLQLAVWEQLSHAQIALVLECSVNAVGIRLHRARKAFAAELVKPMPPSGHSPITPYSSPTSRAPNDEPLRP